MSYFNNRPRARSKLTEEESQELRDHLTNLSAHELRLIILSAANESSDVARRIAKVMRDTGLISQTSLQPVRPQPFEVLCAPKTGLLTPTDVSDDSEMSGTENIRPEQPNHLLTQSACFTSTTPHIATLETMQPGLSSMKCSNKRKTFADRDCNSSFSSTPLPRTPPTLCKRRRPIFHSSESSSQPEKIHCVNCGLWTSDSKFENPHSCIYHPGTFEYDGRFTSWSCCSNGNLKSRGCLITEHKGLDQDAWLFGSHGANGLYGGQQSVDGMNSGDGMISQYARLISSKA